MSEELVIDGKTYVSSKRASEISGYAQDYIGQLARASLIDSHRIGGLWFVAMDSLQSYKEKAATVVPRSQQQHPQRAESDALVTFDGKDYVSASRAAQMTGYHQDYVGQLARTGKILSRQIGNRWYVDRDGIMTHKDEKDRLLAAVQTQSVGLLRPAERKIEPPQHAAREVPFYSYANQERPLMPRIEPKTQNNLEIARTQARPLEILDIAKVLEEEKEVPDDAEDVLARPIPIKVHTREPFEPAGRNTMKVRGAKNIRIPKKTIFYGVSGGAAVFAVALIIVFLSAHPSVDKALPEQTADAKKSSLAAAVGTIGDFLEPLLTKELIYRRKK